MSFLKITDPTKRDQIVKEFLEVKKNIRANKLAEKTGKIELQTDLSEFFKPITETQKVATKEITEGLRPIKEGIGQLPQRLPQQRKRFLPPIAFLKRPLTPPPAYSSPVPSTSTGEIKEYFSGSDSKFGIYYKDGDFFIGDKLVTMTEDRRRINVGGKSYELTEGLYELITSKEPSVDEMDPLDISIYTKILKDTYTMYVNNDPKSGKLKSKNDPKVTK